MFCLETSKLWPHVPQSAQKLLRVEVDTVQAAFLTVARSGEKMQIGPEWKEVVVLPSGIVGFGVGSGH